MNLSKLTDKYRGLPRPVKASFWFLVCMVLQKGISVITTPIFTRLLGASAYGEYSIYTSWESILSVFITLKLTYGVYTQGLVKFEDKREEFSVAMRGLLSSIILIYFFVYIIFRNFFNSLFGLNTYEMLAMFIILWADSIFDFWLCEKRVDYDYKNLVIVSLIVSVVKPLAGIFAVMSFEDKVTARIISMAIVNVIFYVPLLYGKIKLRKPFISKKIWIYALKFNLPLIPHYLSQTVLSKADAIMIGKFIGTDKTGIYNLSYSLALIMLIFNNAIMQTMTPWMYGKMKDEKIDEIKGVAYLALIFVAAMNMFLIVFAPEIIAVFAPPEFNEAIWVIPPIAMSSVFIFSYDLFSSYEFYYAKTVFVMIASIGGAILNIILNYIFINKFGYIAAGYTTLICYILYAAGHYVFMNKICDDQFPGHRPYELKNLLTIYVLFMTIGFGVMFTYNYFIARMVIIAILLLIAFICRNRIIDMVKKMIAIRKNA